MTKFFCCFPCLIKPTSISFNHLNAISLSHLHLKLYLIRVSLSFTIIYAFIHFIQFLMTTHHHLCMSYYFQELKSIILYLQSGCMYKRCLCCCSLLHPIHSLLWWWLLWWWCLFIIHLMQRIIHININNN